MKYTSITRNFRGFNYQNDWDEIVDWEAEMRRNYEKENEIEWSILVDVYHGNPIMQYRRGAGCYEIQIVGL